MLSVERPQGVSILVVERERAAGGCRRDSTQTESQQDSGLYPGVGPPAPVAASRGGAHGSSIEGSLESLESLQGSRLFAWGNLLGVALDGEAQLGSRFPRSMRSARS